VVGVCIHCFLRDECLGVFKGALEVIVPCKFLTREGCKWCEDVSTMRIHGTVVIDGAKETKVGNVGWRKKVQDSSVLLLPRCRPINIKQEPSLSISCTICSQWSGFTVKPVSTSCC
jgi:hypothetical protein